MNQEQRDQVKDALEKLEVSLIEELEEAKKNSQPVKLDQQAVGRVSRVDAIQQQQMHLAAKGRIERRLQLVKSAKVRVKTDRFGICAVCEEEIEIKRLLARPESPVCVSCAKNNA